MKKINLIVAMLSIGLLVSGCTSKNGVSFDSESTGINVKSSTKSVSSEVSDKLSYINVVESEIDGESVSLKSVHFQFDKFNITDNMGVIVKENYKVVSDITNKNTNVKIKLEGNCDEWGTDEYNYALGLKRAKTIKDSLVEDGISADKIVLVSFGESNPVCSDKSDKCWKKNRRVDYRLLP